MSNKKLTLEQELKRYKNIIGYGCLNEAENDFNSPEFDPNAPQDDTSGQEAPPQGQEPNQEFSQDPGQEFGQDPGQEFGQEPAPAEPTTTPEGDTEVDVSDLVKGIEDANNSANDARMQIGNAVSNIEALLSKIDGLESRLGVMDQLLGKVDQLNLTVEKMRPPTETERIQAMKQNSYPYNVSPEDYLNKSGDKTATDLENKSSKLSFKDILNDFNAMDVKSSFNYSDPINTQVDNLMPPYRN